MSDAGPVAFEFLDVPDDHFAEHEEVFGELAAEVRRLVELTIRSEADPADVRAVTAQLRAANDILGEQVRPGPAGVSFNATGRSWNWGNAVVGERNAIAPPLVIEHPRPGEARAEVHLGAAYEGPPGMVHGGVSALLLDHLMGETASNGFTRVTMTGTLTLRYVAPLPLGDLVLAARIAEDDGRKVTVVASIGSAEQVAVEATGLFIVPSWAARPDAGAAARSLP
ncbi:MAG: PaaI family thioesterase [Nocardioides sp.]